MMLRLIYSIIIVSLACSCAKPQPEELIQGRIVSMAYLKSLYRGYPVKIDEDMTLVVRIVGNDIYGNVHNTLFVQDDTGGMRVAVKGKFLCDHFLMFDQVVIRCNGLWIHSISDDMTICFDVVEGKPIPIPENRAKHFIRSTRTPNLKDIEPPIKSIATLTHDDIGRYIRFEDVALESYNEFMRWSDGESIYTTHYLIDRLGNKIAMPVSLYAAFARYEVPPGRGMVAGILTRFYDEYQLTVCDYSLVRLDNPR